VRKHTKIVTVALNPKETLCIAVRCVKLHGRAGVMIPLTFTTLVSLEGRRSLEIIPSSATVTVLSQPASHLVRGLALLLGIDNL